MIIKTRDFGYVEIPKEEIISFPAGVFGFEDIKEFVILDKKVDGEEIRPFLWLQAVKSMSLCFVVFDPFVIFPAYQPELPLDALAALQISDVSEIRYLTIAVIPDDFRKTTVNLRCPIVINAVRNLAMQVVLEGDEYPVRQLLFHKEICEAMGDLQLKKAEEVAISQYRREQMELESAKMAK